jgi:mono/diheme cytochrome c family protein
MRFIAAGGALAFVMGVLAAVFFFGGFYSVAGTSEDPAIVRWALARVSTASVERHAGDVPPATIGLSAIIRSGAREFTEYGCANCHGAPGENWAKFSEGLRPAPPDLKEIVNDRTPAQLFWVIKNGINMTGMPSFGIAGASDDDLWKIVAFLKQLPTVTEKEFKAWSAAAPAPPAASEVLFPAETAPSMGEIR